MSSPNHKCAPSDIALKSLFLGPQSENGDWFAARVGEVLQHTIDWRRSRFPEDGSAVSVSDSNEDEFRELRQKLDRSLSELLKRLESETPKFTPRYIGHMVSEISLPALLGEFALLLHNPNNASHEAARVGLQIEREAISSLAEMIGFDPEHARGHFTSCGTIANFEGLWRSLHWLDRRMALALFLIEKKTRGEDEFFDLCHMSHQQYEELIGALELKEEELSKYSLLKQGPWKSPVGRILKREYQGPIILVPGSRHYSWPKAASVFGLGAENAWTIELDQYGRLSVEDLKEKVKRARAEMRPIVCVVSVAGTTELGEIDPIADVHEELARLKREETIHLWHHVDAAYGGYLATTLTSSSPVLSPEVVRNLQMLSHVDSITIDPHKLGYIPYACGTFIARDSDHYSSFQVQAPYLKTNETALAGWSNTLEGSRSAAGAAAVWLTSMTIPFTSHGFGRILEKTISARESFAAALSELSGIRLVSPADTNVLCFSVLGENKSLEDSNRATLKLFDSIEAGPKFSVSRTNLSRADYSKMIERLCAQWGIVDDGCSDLAVIRLVLMNPFIASKEMKTDFAMEFVREIEDHLSE